MSTVINNKRPNGYEPKRKIKRPRAVTNSDDEKEEIVEEDEDDSSFICSDEEYEDEEEDVEDLKEMLENFKKSDPAAYDSLQNVQDEIKRTEPNINEILKAPMRLEDRAKLCQYYEIYKSHVPNTFEWLEARDSVNKMFRQCKEGYVEYMKYSEKSRSDMDKQVKTFKKHDANLALRYRILGLETSPEIKQIIFRKYEEFQEMSTSDDEYSKMRNWLKWAVDIPHDNIKRFDRMSKKITTFIQKASKRLDNELYGMDKVKEQILMFLTSKLTNPDMKKSNLGLVGAPGTGKTSIARLIAELLDIGFEQISFGGVDKPDFLKGHEYAYIGSQPGEIVKCLCRMGHKNGILFLDEYEKISDNKDLCSALLHITDPSQNNEFRDLFLSEIPIDLSQLWFVYSMNSLPEDSALRDRIFSIEIPGYNTADKVRIIKDYLLPKALKNANVKHTDVNIDEKTCEYLVRKTCESHDKGVRTIEKTISDIMNKIRFVVTHQDKDGKLPFKVSFAPDKKLNYPLEIDKNLIDIFVEDKKISTTTEKLLTMYI